MRRKQIINPLVGYARRAIGPFSYRIGQSTYAQTFGRRAQEVFSMLGFGADADGRIRMLPRGAGSVTFTRDTAGSLTDFESLVQTGQVEEMRFDDARRVENIWPPGSSEDFSEKPGGQVDYSNATVAADGNTVTVSSILGFGFLDVFTVEPGEVYTLSIETSGGTCEGVTNAVRDKTNETFIFTDMKLTLGERSARAFTVPAGCTAIRIYTFRRVTTIGTIIFENAQLERGDKVSEYVSKGVLSGPSYHGVNVDGVAQFAHDNGLTVDSNDKVTEANGADLTTEWGALFEPASPNVLTQSEDFTTGGGAWGVAVNTETVESAVLSPLQGKNWWRLQSDTTGAMSALYLVSGVSAKDAAAEDWTATVYVEKDQIDWVRLRIRDTTGTKRVEQFYDLTNGVVGTSSALTWSYVNSGLEEVSTGIYRIRLTALTDTATGLSIRMDLAEGDGDVNITLNAGDGLYIQGAQIEKNVVPTSYIPTNGTAVTRTIDDGSEMFDLEGNFDQSKGSLVVDLRWTSNYDDISEEVEELIAVSQLTRGLLFYCSNPATIPIGLYSYDQTNLCRIDLPFVANKTYRVGLTWSVANGINLSWRNITDAGAWQTWANTPFDGMYTTVGTSIRIARLDDLYRPVLFRDLRIWQQDLGTDFIEGNY